MLFSRRDLVKIIVPLVLQQILSVTIGTADSMMVSHAGESAVSGVSLVSTLDVLLILVFSSLISGGSVVVSQALGKKNHEEARSSAKQLLYVSTGIATLVTVTVLLLRKPLLSLLFGAVEEEVMMHAQSYFFFIALSFPFLAIESTGTSLFRSMGNSLISLLVSLLKNVVNIGGNTFLIIGLGWGAAGAAIATLASRILGAAIMLVLLHNQKHPIYIDRILHYRPDRKVIRSILGIGVPNGIENGMFHFGKLMTQTLISWMGTAAIASNAVALALANFQYMAGSAFSSTMITVVGRCIGAKEPGQAKHYARLLTALNYLALWAVVLFTFIFAKPLISIYGLSEQAAGYAHQMLLFHSACAALIWPIAFTLPSAFRAASDIRFPLVVSMFSMWTFRVALGYVFSLETVTVFGIRFPGLNMGVMGVWVAMMIDWIFRTVLFLIRYFSGKWLAVYRPPK